MKVLIVGYYKPPKLGVGVYMDCLIPELLKACKKDCTFELMTNKQFVELACVDLGNFAAIHVMDSLSSSLKTIFYMLFVFPFFCRFRKYDAILLLSNPIVSFGIKNAISVIHDLNEFEDKKKYGLLRSFYRRRIMLDGAVKNSKRIIAISWHVHRQIGKFFRGKYIEKTTVIHNGIAGTVSENNHELLNRSSENTYLIVGRIDPSGKNLWRALDLFKSLQRVEENNLILVGGINDSTRKEANRFLQIVNEEQNIKYMGYISTEELKALYKKVKATIFYSKMEGFGFPLLEAFSYGCPVITHPDNDAARELSEGMDISVEEQLIRNPSSLKQFVNSKINKIDKEKLKEISQKYNWENVANNYVQVLEETICR